MHTKEIVARMLLEAKKKQELNALREQKHKSHTFISPKPVVVETTSMFHPKPTTISENNQQETMKGSIVNDIQEIPQESSIVVEENVETPPKKMRIGSKGRKYWKDSFLATVYLDHRKIIDSFGEVQVAALCDSGQSTVFRWRHKGIPKKYWRTLVNAGVCTYQELGIDKEQFWQETIQPGTRNVRKDDKRYGNTNYKNYLAKRDGNV